MKKQIKVQLIKSRYGRKPSHMATLKGLRLLKINQTVIVNTEDPCLMGMVEKVKYLLKIEAI
jgi:large subunit ribosomal protein L30